MKNNRKNIMNLAEFTNLKYLEAQESIFPNKNSVVKLTAIEYLKNGVKVTIDGKVYIASIDERIPLKEEVMAIVTNNKPFLISLNLSSLLKRNQKSILDQIISKLSLKNSERQRKLLVKIIEEGVILRKSKITQLNEVLKFINTSGLELSLLINLVWKHKANKINFVEDIYNNLFVETFENVCNNLFNSTSEIIFSNLPQYILQPITSSIIYSEKSNNISPLLNKTNQFIKLVKLLIEFNKSRFGFNEKVIDTFITNATKYIFQKSILKDYDYYPDFVIVKKEEKLSLINYRIKKTRLKNNSFSYKVMFKNEDLGLKIKSIIRENYLLGNIDIQESSIDYNNEVLNFQNQLFDNWGINSEFNNHKNEDYYNINDEAILNKLVS